MERDVRDGEPEKGMGMKLCVRMDLRRGVDQVE